MFKILPLLLRMSAKLTKVAENIQCCQRISCTSFQSTYIHMQAAICSYMNTSSMSEPVEHEDPSLERLLFTARCVVEKYVVSKESKAFKFTFYHSSRT